MAQVEARVKASDLTLVAFLSRLGFSFFDVAVVVECDVFFITFQKQLIPFGSVNTLERKKRNLLKQKNLKNMS